MNRGQRKQSTAILAGLIVLWGALFPLRPAHAWVVYCTNCSTYTTQLLQYAKDAETALQTANAYAEQIKMYENMVTQGATLTHLQWGTITDDLNTLNTLVAQGTNISYATNRLTSQFASDFPDYTSFLAAQQSASQTRTDLENWSTATNDAVKTSLQAAAQQASQMSNETALLSTIQSHSTDAVGQMQAIQAGNEMSAQVVQQLQKLRQLIMTQMDLQAQALAAAQREKSYRPGFDHYQYRNTNRRPCRTEYRLRTD
jgi:P-type conjugative transfer protein TrbJ